MFLTITGKLGSGKSTICKILTKKHGFKIYSTGEIQRKIALDMGISTLELNELMRKDSKYDDLIDNEVVRISQECRDENIIFDSRMAFHFVEDAYDIFATIDPSEAARRVMLSPRGNEETYVDQLDAQNKLLERSRLENVRFKEIYQIDNLDYSNYNLVIDTSWNEPENLADIIYKMVCQDRKGEKHQILISPKSLYPTEKLTNINMDKVEAYRHQSLKVEDEDVVSVIYFENYHYVIDGHHRLLAALLDERPFVKAEFINYDKYPFFKDTNNLISELQHIGKSTLYDYEDAGKFSYKSYPDYYL